MNLTARQMPPEEVASTALDFYDTLVAFQRDLEKLRGTSESAFISSYFLSKSWPKFHIAGVLLAQAVLGNKEIPQGQAKKIELAARLFMSIRKMPNKPVTWYDKNATLIRYLYDAAIEWHNKTEDSTEQKFKLGPFTVHNTMGLSGKDLEGTKDALEKAILLLKGSKVPGIEKVLYGDIMIVGKINKGNVLAFYYSAEDVVYVRPFKNAGADELHNTIHELGHRYTKKFIDKGTWREWGRYHDSLTWKRVDVKTELPKVGDTLPFLIKGVRGKPVIQRIVQEPGLRFPLYYLSESKAVQEPQLRRWLEEVATSDAKYPTPYAAKSADEHFCEALAFRCMGKLKEPGLSAFKAIIEDGKEYQMNSVQKVAAQYMSRQAADTWADNEVYTKEIREKIRDFLNMVIREGREVAKAVEEQEKIAVKRVEGGGRLTKAEMTTGALKVIEKTWGDDAMAKYFARMIASGEYLW